MTGTSPALERDYEEALKAFLAGGGEDVLKRAYDLGRRAVDEDSGLLAMVLLHQQVLAGVLTRARALARLELVRRSMQFLAECLAPFEMAHRGFQDAYARLRQLNEEYESAVAERTREFQNAEARFRAHVEHLPAVTYVESVRTRAHVYVSPQVEALLGFTPRQWLEDRRRWARQIHPEDSDRILVEMSKFRQGGETFRDEYRLMARDGRLVWVRHIAARILDGAGRTQFIQGAILDISDRKRAEAAGRECEARFRALFAHSGEALLMVSAKDRFVMDANAAAAKLIGGAREELLAKPLAELFPADHARIGPQNGAGHGARLPPHVDAVLRTRQGGDRAVRVQAFLSRIGEVPCVVCLIHAR